MIGFRLTSPLGLSVSHDVLLGRWRLGLDLFGRVFCDDVGAEPGSVISELGGFPVKESKFRREMEKLRNSTQRDLTLEVRISHFLRFSNNIGNSCYFSEIFVVKKSTKYVKFR